jgi:Protein of unknown function (DUF3048) N-terminal domain/Protein of unknown function (DUF3048) C-terminal domain
MRRFVFLCIVIAVVATACGGGNTPAPTAETAANTQPPAATQPAATAAAAANTPLPAATAAPTDTPEASPTALPPGQIGPDNFPADVDPLTGLQVADPSVLDRRPLLIKISNFPGEVRPQSGMSYADMVFEHYAEGGVTRFTALYWSQTPSTVGSVRSARLIDLELPAMYQALFAYSGSSDEVKNRIRDSDFFDRVFSPDWGDPCPLFCREGELAAPNNEFAHPPDIWDEAAARGLGDRPTVNGMVFNPTPAEGGLPANVIRVVYSGGFARWDYEPDKGLYVRRQDSDPIVDKLNGQRLRAANVIVVYATHVPTDIIEDQASKRPGLEIQAWGADNAYIFRDGQVYVGRWARPDRGDMLHFYFGDGQTPVPLKPGVTWIEFVGVSTPNKTEGAGDEWRFEPPPNGP